MNEADVMTKDELRMHDELRFMSREEKAVYIAWCFLFDREHEMELLENLKSYKECVKEADVHCGDCTQVAAPCMACILDDCKKSAENILSILKTRHKIYKKGEPKPLEWYP